MSGETVHYIYHQIINHHDVHYECRLFNHCDASSVRTYLTHQSIGIRRTDWHAHRCFGLYFNNVEKVPIHKTMPSGTSIRIMRTCAYLNNKFGLMLHRYCLCQVEPIDLEYVAGKRRKKRHD